MDALPLRPPPLPRLSRADMLRLTTVRNLPNLTKIPLFLGLMVAAGWVAWTTTSSVVLWTAYVALGYLWMGIVTFMHDGTHDTLFARPWLNTAFGVVAMIPIGVSFIAFQRDHLEHHRYNRSPRDPDAFTMGSRGFLDFLQFYAYLLVGGVLTVLQFTIVYPIQKFDARAWRIHTLELLARFVAIGAVLALAAAHGVLGHVLALWLVPAYAFTLLNSMRFIGEHYGTPWEQGQLLGTRTITSHPLNSFFWNNINYHIGHHVYPATPWYNLQKLHAALAPEIAARGAVVESSYLRVLWRSCVSGPESIERNERQLAAHSAANIPTASVSRTRGSA